MKRMLFFFLAVFAAASLSAQSVEKVLDQYFANVGGLDKWKALQSTKMEGKMAMQGFEFPGTLINKAPNKMRVDVNVQGMNIV